jgi:hypothetical protein
MFQTLCHPIWVLQVHGLPDGAGGWRETMLPPVKLWAAIKALPPLKDPTSSGGKGKAPAPVLRLAPERYEIHLREHPFSGTLREIHWGSKVLTPLTPLSPAAQPGYVKCQAILTRHRPGPSTEGTP